MSDMQKMDLSTAVKIAIKVLRLATIVTPTTATLSESQVKDLNRWQTEAADLLEATLASVQKTVVDEHVVKEYEAEMRRAGLDPEAFKTRVRGAFAAGDLSTVTSLFLEIRAKMNQSEPD